MAKRVYNFNPGPATLPSEVIEEASQGVAEFQGLGMSILEMSHRSKEFEKVLGDAVADLRELLGLPAEYHVIFMGGGASLQFAMVPMNFLPAGGSADYINTGEWATKAIKEAKAFGNVNVLASSEDKKFSYLPDYKKVAFTPGAAYAHITTNNTIYGTQYPDYPATGAIPLVADMSSDFLCRAFDPKQFALIYAGAQKNIGPAGVTMVIVREDFLAQAKAGVPTMLSYKTYTANNSLYNTPPVFAIYVVGLVMKWAKKMGGMAEIERRNRAKAGLLYGTIDELKHFYRGTVEIASRSWMNVPFRLPSETLEEAFLKEAKANQLVGLKGHRSVGGIRASIYNAFPLEGVQALVDFMREFARKNG